MKCNISMASSRKYSVFREERREDSANFFREVILLQSYASPYYIGKNPEITSPSIMVKTSFPNGGHYRGVPLYLERGMLFPRLQ